MNWEARLRSVAESLDKGVWDGVYEAISVQPEEVLAAYRKAGVDVTGLAGIAALPLPVVERVNSAQLKSTRLRAAVTGATLGSSGWVGLAPGVAAQLIELIRLGQKVALCFGRDYRTRRGQIELWRGLAIAIGAQLDLEGSQDEVLSRLPVAVGSSPLASNPLVPRLAATVVARLSLSLGPRMARMVPVLGGGVALVANSLQVSRVGRKLTEYYRERRALGSFDPRNAVVVEVLS